MQTLRILDKATSQRIIDDNGYLIVKNNPIAKAGVFEYLLSELRPDIVESDDRIVKVYRPFDSLAKVKDTFANKPIVLQHKWVGEETSQVDGSIGSVISIDKDNLYLRADIIIYNPEVIEKIQNGEIVEFSPGYTGYEIEKKGIFNGDEYEFVQIVNCVNHLALVEVGRSGHDLRVLDSKKQIIKKGLSMKNNTRFSDLKSKILKIFKDEDLKMEDEDLKMQLKELALKPDSEFEGGADEKSKAIDTLLANLYEKDATQDEDTTDKEKQDEEVTQDEDTNKDDDNKEEKQDEELEIETQNENTDKPLTKEEVLKLIKEVMVEGLSEFKDAQSKKLNKIHDTYKLVSNAIGSSFDFQNKTEDDIYKIGYEAITNKTLDKGLDAKTAFNIAYESKNSSKITFKDNSSVKNSNSELMQVLNKNFK